MTSQVRTPNWYVVTGVPSSGITTLVKALRPYVDKTFPEAARIIIDEGIKRGILVEETRRDEGVFQQRVLQMKLRREARASKDKLYVFERGIPDSIPYFIIAGLDPTPMEAYSKGRYKTVFHLEPLTYEMDYARRESDETRIKLNRLLPIVYRNLGYSVIRVPALSVEQRVGIVLSYL